MVKAIKRKPEAAKKPAEKQDKKSRKIQIITLVALGLMVFGWTVGSYFGLGSNDRSGANPEPTTGKIIGGGTPAGSKSGTIGEITDYHAVFGQLDDPLGASERLYGDLYLVDNGWSQIVLTNASIKDIGYGVNGNYIVYNVAFCGDFDCLLDNKTVLGLASNETSRTMTFDLYSLNMSSSFLRTATIGLVSSGNALVL